MCGNIVVNHVEPRFNPTTLKSYYFPCPHLTQVLGTNYSSIRIKFDVMKMKF